MHTEVRHWLPGTGKYKLQMVICAGASSTVFQKGGRMGRVQCKINLDVWNLTQQQESLER